MIEWTNFWGTHFRLRIDTSFANSPVHIFLLPPPTLLFLLNSSILGNKVAFRFILGNKVAFRSIWFRYRKFWGPHENRAPEYYNVILGPPFSLPSETWEHSNSHTVEFHWVTSCSIGGEIQVYSAGKLPPSLQVQLTQIYRVSIERRMVIRSYQLKYQLYSSCPGKWTVACIFAIA